MLVWKKLWGSRQQDTGTNSLLDNIDFDKLPKHIAIIMDGNGRWAKSQGLPRTFGHKAGAEVLRDIVQTSSDIGIKVLTTYAFSTENWKRPPEEVNFLMNLMSDYLDNEIDELDRKNVKIRFIGDIDNLADSLRKKISHAEAQTTNNTGLIFNLAVNYGARAEITNAVKIIIGKTLAGELEPDTINEEEISKHLYTSGLPDPDILIRPSGEMRISNFLLWQLAYTEFWLTDVKWPDFKPEHLLQAIIDYQHRERRFGGLKK